MIKIKIGSGKGEITLIHARELKENQVYLKLPEKAFNDSLDNKQSVAFQVYEDAFFITLNELSWHQKKTDWLIKEELNIYYKTLDLVIVIHSDQSHIESILSSLNPTAYETLSGVMFKVFDSVIENNKKILFDIEKKISLLEDDIITMVEKKQHQSSMDQIIHIRKQIYFLRNCFEPFEDVVENICECNHPLIDEIMKSQFEKQVVKIGRLNDKLVILREYVSEVRESWQAQIDIGLNRTMKIFTVITAVFLPLTLIAGWYGMNFKYMPELSWIYGYPFAFILSFLVIIGSIIFFKKYRFI